jgi:hypothetical protein
VLLESSRVQLEGTTTTSSTTTKGYFCHLDIQLFAGVFQQIPETIEDAQGKM